eukprot:GHUV01035155.1.p1 GENE.GHUV01035155.1~~GHUV01035155.1.p1  ORF type:complete len:567 (+),score=154.25 GHUV01035155.1:681-2381(+)
MWLVAALEKASNHMRSILCLHESVVTGACDGYARIAGKPAASLLHLGPGLGNGLCNLHNARRAGSPILVLVGDMSTWHKSADPPLNQDMESLASTVSGQIITVQSPDAVSAAVRQAVAAMQVRPTAAPAVSAPADPAAARSAATNGVRPLDMGAQAAAAVTSCPGSRVVTLMVPHDVSWTDAPDQNKQPDQSPPAAVDVGANAPNGNSRGPGLFTQHVRLADSPAACHFLKDCAAALRGAPQGKAALILGGAALLSQGGELQRAGRIASALGAKLLCEPLPGRIDRGAGMPQVTRIPYFPQEAAIELRKYEVVLLLDVRRPVAGFGYRDGPSQLLSQHDDMIWELDASWCVAEALELLEREVPGAAAVKPGVNCREIFAAGNIPALPTGLLTAASLCQTVAALQPADTIIVDESLTSGGTYWDVAKGCPRFTQLCLTGGAIGSGPPMATGAAVAAPTQQVINIQADGSAMYSLQSLWTQAREQLKVLTIICANNAYAILKVEAMRQRTGSNALTSLSGPEIDWVSLARGLGVPAGRADTADELAELIHQGLQQQGPFLIHAALTRG